MLSTSPRQTMRRGSTWPGGSKGTWRERCTGVCTAVLETAGNGEYALQGLQKFGNFHRDNLAFGIFADFPESHSQDSEELPKK